MTDKKPCPICNKVHSSSSDEADRKKTNELTETAHKVLYALIEHDNTPADVMFIMATIASSLCASQPDSDGNNIDDRIAGFQKSFEEMARSRYEVVTKLRSVFESLEAFIMQPTDGSVN